MPTALAHPASSGQDADSGVGASASGADARLSQPGAARALQLNARRADVPWLGKPRGQVSNGKIGVFVHRLATWGHGPSAHEGAALDIRQAVFFGTKDTLAVSILSSFRPLTNRLYARFPRVRGKGVGPMRRVLPAPVQEINLARVPRVSIQRGLLFPQRRGKVP